jgi:hypothetical protein
MVMSFPEDAVGIILPRTANVPRSSKATEFNQNTTIKLKCKRA